MNQLLAYKIAPKASWKPSNFWSELDLKDGYIHLSTKDTLVETAEKWYRGQTGLLLICLDLSKQENVRWEPSRNNQLFPHIYGQVNEQAIVWVKDLPPSPVNSGSFAFPDGVL
ncbi:hypothetical protein BASA81_016566 [Batrachochytrium salamandrivorans]|nr:hypothetical protein BASA81_016566 [Batrachochytrium salamandrivorans]